MRRSLLIVGAAAVLGLGCSSPAPDPQPGVDLAKTDRTLRKEPSYQFQPKYTLLVFGPWAKQRAWVVLDSRVTGDFQQVRGLLYVDRNGDGDLTGPGERIGLKKGESSPTEFEPVEINAEDGRKTYRLHIKSQPLPHYPGFYTPSPGYRGGDPRIWVEDVTAKRMYAVRAVSPAERISAERPQDAPIAHVDGPLVMDFALDKPLLPAGKGEYELRAAVVTHGHPRGIMSAMMFDAIPADAHPTAVLEFPGQSADASPVRIEAVLKRRC